MFKIKMKRPNDRPRVNLTQIRVVHDSVMLKRMAVLAKQHGISSGDLIRQAIEYALDNLEE